MILDLWRQIAELAIDDGFNAFQLRVIQDYYETLGQGFSRSENEVALVERLVAATEGKGYGPLNLRAKMLHGSRSYVEFHFRDKPTTRELGDMALITLVTSNRQRVLQKLAIVQNKKTQDKSWGIDLEQLFLLKNFPPLAGHRGIFRGRQDIVFRNTTGTLGCYGLLAPPGEMTFSSAGVLAEFARGKHSVTFDDISLPANSSAGGHRLPLGLWPKRIHPREWIYLMEELLPMMPLGGAPAGSFAGLGNVTFARDLHDLVRAWTTLSVGEPTCVDNTVVNSAVDGFANLLLRSAGMGELADFPGNELFGQHLETQIAVIVAHLKLQE